MTKRVKDLKSLLETAKKFKKEASVPGNKLCPNTTPPVERSWKRMFQVAANSVAAEIKQDVLASRDPEKRNGRKGHKEILVPTLLSKVSETSLREGSFFPKILDDDIELVFFDDRYQQKVSGELDHEGARTVISCRGHPFTINRNVSMGSRSTRPSVR